MEWFLFLKKSLLYRKVCNKAFTAERRILMEKINWKQKLTSRKFWAAVVGFVTALMIAFAAPQATITQVTGIITAGATLIAYIVGEGMIDAASAGATVNITGNPTITGVEDTATAEADKAAQKAISGTVQADGGKNAA
jgi:uncharacterized membrane protein